MAEPVPNPDPTRPLALFGIALSGVLASAALGAITNAVNGWISPQYFVTVLRWQDVEDVWRASIAQGIFEGLCFGVFFSLVFTSGVGIITRASCRYSFGIKYLLCVVAGALVCWVIAGAAAMGLAWLSPEFYRHRIIGVPEDTGEMLRYAWVGGSILGLQLGGFLSLVATLLVLRGNWLRRIQHDVNRAETSTLRVE